MTDRAARRDTPNHVNVPDSRNQPAVDNAAAKAAEEAILKDVGKTAVRAPAAGR